jgi:hypothetical protein
MSTQATNRPSFRQQFGAFLRRELNDMRQTARNTFNPRSGGFSIGQFLDGITEPLVQGDFYNSSQRRMNSFGEVIEGMNPFSREAGQPGATEGPATRAGPAMPATPSAVPQWLNPRSAGPRAPTANPYGAWSTDTGEAAAPRFFWESGYGGVWDSREGLYGTGNGMMRAPDQPVPGAARGARRGDGVLIGDREAAQAFARGIGHANSGLGASSYGRDRMNSQWREA